MTSEEYWRMFHAVRGDIESAMASNAAYFKIQNMAAGDRKILQKYNRTPDFWRLCAHAFQKTFFISLGCVFDKRRDAWSIYDLIDNTIKYVGLFSKSALRERKRATSSMDGKDPAWLDNYMATAWEPTRKDLEELRDAHAPHAQKFNETYQPIRHIHFAHRGKASAEDIYELFGRTQIDDATEMLRFLYTLVFEIWEIYLNGRKPDLSNFREYDLYVKNLNAQTEKLILSLS
jgi:hypothetical protein